MCDEYDDERMRAFWRQLAQQEELADLEDEREKPVDRVVLPVGEIVEPKRAKPRILTR